MHHCIGKAADIAVSFITNSPYTDENKKIGCILMGLTHVRSGLDIVSTKEEIYL